MLKLDIVPAYHMRSSGNKLCSSDLTICHSSMRSMQGIVPRRKVTVREHVNSLARGTITEQADTMNDLKGKVILRADVGNLRLDYSAVLVAQCQHQSNVECKSNAFRH